jgi:hypothetical protein
MAHILKSVLGNTNKDATPAKIKTRRSKLKQIFHSAQKTKFEDLQNKIFVDVEGCLGHPQDYDLHHS